MLKKILLQGEQKKVLFLPADNPIQIKGVAGSGKTTVALYRAKHLLDTQNTLFQEAKVVIFTFSKPLAAYIRSIAPYINGGYQKDNDVISPKTPDGLDIHIINFHSWAYKFIGLKYGRTVSQRDQLNIINNIKFKHYSNVTGVLSKSAEFFQEEISWMKGKNFSLREEYVDAKRTGRGTTDRVTKNDKDLIWDVFERYKQELKNMGKVDFDDYAILALDKIESDSEFVPPYTHIIIDEAQDLSKSQILTISKLVDKETNSISIIADAAQRIFKTGFIWSEVGINVRGGRTIEFKKNYRNSVFIANAALSLLSHEQDSSEFTLTETALNGGSKPKVGYFNSFSDELNKLYVCLSSLKDLGSIDGTVVLHRTNTGVNNIEKFLQSKGYSTERVKSERIVDYDSESIKICTMSSIKGLEFNNVFIIDLNEDEIPFPPGFIDTNDEFHISTERRLLYTCMTRAKNNLYLFSYGTPTRYLNEIESSLLENISDQSLVCG